VIETHNNSKCYFDAHGAFSPLGLKILGFEPIDQRSPNSFRSPSRIPTFPSTMGRTNGKSTRANNRSTRSLTGYSRDHRAAFFRSRRPETRPLSLDVAYPWFPTAAGSCTVANFDVRFARPRQRQTRTVAGPISHSTLATSIFALWDKRRTIRQFHHSLKRHVHL